MQMSLTRVLAEIKSLTKRLSEPRPGRAYIDLIQKKNKVTNELKVGAEDASKAIKANYESYMKLLGNLEILKCALVKANADTTVDFADAKFTISELVSLKGTLPFKRGLLAVLRKQQMDVNSAITTLNNQTETKIEALIATNYGSGKNSSATNTADLIEAIGKPLREQESVTVIDPIGVQAHIDALEEEIALFEIELDFVLSEVNAKTVIEVAI